MARLVPHRWTAVGIGLIIASIVLLALESNIGAFITLGLGAILLVGAAFFAVGRSEEVHRRKHPHG
jgi:hypothetical protein